MREAKKDSLEGNSLSAKLVIEETLIGRIGCLLMSISLTVLRPRFVASRMIPITFYQNRP